MLSPSQKKDSRQPWRRVSHTARGTITSWPADMAPPRIPSTSPRRASNQRAATVAAVDMPMPPAPSAMRTPAVT
jgi:hypothetical protein